MADYISTTGAAGVNEVLKAEYFTKVFLSTLEAGLVFKKWGMMGRIPNGEGKNAYWPKVENIGTGYTTNMEGSDPSATAWSANAVSAALNEYKQWHRVSDWYRDSSLGGTMEQLIQRIAYKSSLDVDTIIRDAVFTAGGKIAHCHLGAMRKLLQKMISKNLGILPIDSLAHVAYC